MAQNSDAQNHIKDAIGVFASEQDLESAIDALLTSGFNRADLSLLAGEPTIKAKLGHSYKSVKELEDDSTAPSVAYVSKESIGAAEGAVIGAPIYILGATAAGVVAAAGGPFALGLAAIASAAGAGAAFGVVLTRYIGRQHAELVENQLDHGGILLWVRTWSREEEQKAAQILTANNASDVHIHDFSTDTEAFASPEDILTSNLLSAEAKILLLKRWEYDVREMLVAEEEGMGDCNGELLSRILKALSALGDGPDLEHSPPTKQGGI